MRSWLIRIALFFLALAGLGWFAFQTFRPQPTDVEATVTPQILVPHVTRFGLNLGSWTFWGAEQLSSNVIKNPGFEGLIDGAIAIPVHTGDNNFDDSPAWLARPEGFWAGARYNIRTGPNAGQSGTLIHSTPKNLFGLPAFTARAGDPVPFPGDAVALVRDQEDSAPKQWWFSKDPANHFSPEPRQIRPGSPGTRSLRISAGSYSAAEVDSYLDDIGDRAGKMLALNGQWTLSFWVKLDRGNANLRVLFGRDKSKPALAQSVELSREWRNVRLTFDAHDDGPPGIAALRFQVDGQPAGEILLDDVDLRRTRDANSPFRAEVVSLLQRLHPAYLRDWQGQLGDTLANRIAPAFARKSFRYRPTNDDTQTDFGYGLDDFLALAANIDASPWIVVPPSFDDNDCAGLGTWLSAPGRIPAGRETLVEFGNENWNELFRPGAVADPVKHGEAADRCLGAVRLHAAGVNLKTVVNAQYVNPRAAIAYARESHNADIVAVAPYFALSMPKGLSFARRNTLLFEPGGPTMDKLASGIAPLHKDLAVYEVNLHTVNGDASEAERRPVVAGMASGSALARRMLDALSRGMRRQCVYAFTGFDAGLQNVKGHAPLWGIARDIGATPRLRPTGLALDMLNQVLGGDMRKVDQRGPADAWIYAFATESGISIAAISGSETIRHVVVTLPEETPGGHLMELRATSPGATNEQAEEVSIGSARVTISGRTASFDLQPWSMAVLLPGKSLREKN